MLSNTIWPRDWHEGFFRRDGVDHLIDGDVYTSEIPWTKPARSAFAAAMAAVGVTDPARCVYVGDRLYDDVWGAHNAGLRAIHVPHSTIPVEPGRPHRGRAGRRGARAGRDPRPGPGLVLTRNFCMFVQRENSQCAWLGIAGLCSG